MAEVGPIPAQMQQDAREAQLRNRIAELEQELHDRPTQTVDRWIDRDKLDEAREEALRASQPKTRVMIG